MTARLDLLTHGATTANRVASFSADEPLEPSAVAALKAARGRLKPYGRVLVAPERAARDSAAALGYEGDIAPTLKDCDYGRWRGLALMDVVKREPEALDLWLDDPAAAPHGGESFAAVLGRVAAWLAKEQTRSGTTLAVTHAPVVRAAIVSALGAGPAAFWRIDAAPLSLARLTGHDGRWNLVSLSPLGSDA